METTLSIGARYLKRGDTFDIEDSRMTNRLCRARAILQGLGIEPTKTHSDHTTVEFGRPRHFCDYRCETSWPAQVSDETFNTAFTLADLTIREGVA